RNSLNEPLLARGCSPGIGWCGVSRADDPIRLRGTRADRVSPGKTRFRCESAVSADGGGVQSKMKPQRVVALGQSGFRFQIGAFVIYIDPYLSDSVEKLEGRLYRRQVPIWKPPELVNDADCVLITHGHRDHCDLETLLPLSKVSSACRFVAPNEVCRNLASAGIAADRLLRAPNRWLDLAPGICVHAAPAA